jgi:tRNA(Ile)-lysidine synthase
MAHNQSAHPDIPEILRIFLHDHQPAEVDVIRVLVAVSGGADSMALLAGAIELARKQTLGVVAAHLIHDPQSDEALARVTLVQEYCLKNDVPLLTGTLTGSDDSKMSPEERMREGRYRFLEKTASEQKCNFILTGHHSNDQAETILHRILAGTSLRGLSGIQAVRETVLRPLLYLRKEDLQQYCYDHQIPFSDDPTNFDLDKPRNYIRYRLLPQIEKDINPNVQDALLRLGERASEVDELIASAVQQCWQKSLLNFQKGKIVLDIRSILAYFTSIRKYTVQKAISDLAGLDVDLKSTDFDRIDDFLQQSRTGSYLEFPGDIRLTRDRQSLVVTFGSVPEVHHNLVPGRDEAIPEFDAEVRWSRPEAAHLQSGDGHAADLEIGKGRGKLILRFARERDRFHPLGSRGEKRLFRFLADRKVSRFEKRATPVLVQGDTIIWVVGHRISEVVRVNDPDKHTWRLHFIPAGSNGL